MNSMKVLATICVFGLVAGLAMAATPPGNGLPCRAAMFNAGEGTVWSDCNQRTHKLVTYTCDGDSCVVFQYEDCSKAFEGKWIIHQTDINC